MNLLIQIFLLIFLFNVNAFSGESGELPGQEVQQVEENTEVVEEISEEISTNLTKKQKEDEDHPKKT